jgi:hypothetical protein
MNEATGDTFVDGFDNGNAPYVAPTRRCERPKDLEHSVIACNCLIAIVRAIRWHRQGRIKFNLRVKEPGVNLADVATCHRNRLQCKTQRNKGLWEGYGTRSHQLH